jgi:tetratricopeptide (TPR) repeat protein
MSAPEIFISHTHSDKGIADAIRDALANLFGEAVTVVYSTNKQADGGVGHGADWFRWIQDRVGASQLALILLTPSSIQKPWVLWEAGAVAGAAIASGGKFDKVRPLTFQLGSKEIPQPFQRAQTEPGDRKEGATRFFEQVVAEFAGAVTPTRLMEAGKRLDKTVDTYIARVRHELRDAPTLPSEEAIQEWCSRLDGLRQENRFSETRQMHAWLKVAFGRDIEGVPQPIDLRIHRRLGALYLSADDPGNAAAEFRLARTLGPRDMFILRSLGQALLDLKDSAGAGEVIERMKELHPGAFEENVECAALLAKWSRQKGDVDGAIDAYEKALDANPDSYYLADVLGQTLLERGRKDKAREKFERALEIVEKLGEVNLWSRATGATAAIVLGNDEKAASHLRAIAALKIGAGERASIEGALRQVADRVDKSRQWLDVWRPILHGEVQ